MTKEDQIKYKNLILEDTSKQIFEADINFNNDFYSTECNSESIESSSISNDKNVDN